MSISPGYAAFKLAFQLSPIIFTNGIATNIPGGMLPIIAITEGLNFAAGLLGSGNIEDLDDFFAVYEPLSGTTLADYDFGKYPFANQAVAANAIIAQPLTVSLLMRCPVRQPFGYAAKLGIMTALMQSIKQHSASGGTYTVATPVGFFPNCILLRITDASGGEDKQRQTAFRWDFTQPLLTLEQAQQAQNSLMSRLSSGSTIPGSNGAVSWSGLSPSVGSTTGLAGISVVPAVTTTPGASLAGSGG